MTHQQQTAADIATANALAINTMSDTAYRRQLEAETRRVVAGQTRIDGESTPALCDLYFAGKAWWYSGACDHARRPSFTWRGRRYRLESNVFEQLRVFCESGRVSIKGNYGSATQDQYEGASHAR